MLSLSLQLLPHLSFFVPITQKWKPLLDTSHPSSPIIPRKFDRPLASSVEDIAVAKSFNDLINGIIKPKSASEEEDNLPTGLQRAWRFMDGNGRWAQMRGLPVGAGYEAGLRAFRDLVKLCCKWGIRVLTVFAFSADNWFRPKMEVDFLMGLFERGLQNELEAFMRDDIRISVIGDTSKLPRNLCELINKAEMAKMNNSGLHLVVQACKKISQKVKEGLIEAEDIDEFIMEQELETKYTDFPCLDLHIRTILCRIIWA